MTSDVRPSIPTDPTKLALSQALDKLKASPVELSEDLELPTRRQGAGSPKYRLISSIGSGSYGRVWRAHAVHKDTFVAIKVFFFDTSLSDKVNELRLKAFWSGATRLGRAGEHPSIASIVDGPHIDPKGLVWFVMKYFDGGDLDARIDSTELGWDDRWQICSDLVEALEFCHSKNPPLLHRDVRARNVLLSKKRAVLADFDLSYGRVHGRTTSFVARPVTPPRFLPPSLRRAPRRDEDLARFNRKQEDYLASQKADVWALCVMILDVFTRTCQSDAEASGKVKPAEIHSAADVEALLKTAKVSGSNAAPQLAPRAMRRRLSKVLGLALNNDAQLNFASGSELAGYWRDAKRAELLPRVVIPVVMACLAVSFASVYDLSFPSLVSNSLHKYPAALAPVVPIVFVWVRKRYPERLDGVLGLLERHPAMSVIFALAVFTLTTAFEVHSEPLIRRRSFYIANGEGCTIKEGGSIQRNITASAETYRASTVTSVLWCPKGRHPFVSPASALNFGMAAYEMSTETDESSVSKASLAVDAGADANDLDGGSKCPPRTALVQGSCAMLAEVTAEEVRNWSVATDAGVDMSMGAIGNRDRYASLCDGSTMPGNFPANCINWYKASEYCKSRGGHLPSLREWTVAFEKLAKARAASTSRRGLLTDEVGNVCGSLCLLSAANSKSREDVARYLDAGLPTGDGGKPLPPGVGDQELRRLGLAEKAPNLASVDSSDDEANAAAGLLGNVSEWLSEEPVEGVAAVIGRDWAHTAAERHPLEVIRTIAVTRVPYIGFRCVLASTGVSNHAHD